MELKERPIIVLGSTGTIGRNLFVWARQRKNQRSVIGTYAHHVHSDRIFFDLLESSFSELAQGRKGVLFFCAGISNTEQVFREFPNAENINFQKTVQCLNEAIDLGWFPVFLSSDKVYGSSKQAFLETDVCSPITRYGELKYRVENWLLSQRVPCLILRISKVFSGENQGGNPMAALYQAMSKGQSVQMATNQRLNPIHIDDVISIIELLLENNQSGIWNLAGPETLSRYEMAEVVREAFKFRKELVCPILLEDLALSEPHPESCILSTSKLRQKFEFQFKSYVETCSQFRGLLKR